MKRLGSVGLVLIAGLAISIGSVSAEEESPPVDGECQGGNLHYGHVWPLEPCVRDVNPHFPRGQTGNGADCDHGGVAKNCNGCYSCCNGVHDENIDCVCGSMRFSIQAAITAQSNCRGDCIGTWNGNGCTDPEHRIGPGDDDE